ncbi:CRISPR-associated helicase/endonuclease Cas3, partial [Bacillus thuringiensis]|nr:CRISPR-associated helicase/endonuclease Cas3 [Bacillus thuringiensis]
YQLCHTENMIPYKGIISEIVGNAIISHHGYLQDILNPDLESHYLNRVRDKQLRGFDVTEQLFLKNVMKEKDFHEYVDKATVELERFLLKEYQENAEKQ